MRKCVKKDKKENEILHSIVLEQIIYWTNSEIIINKTMEVVKLFYYV